MTKQIINTENAPSAIGTYSQAVAVNGTVYISGQIPLNPVSMEIVTGEINKRIHQVFKNLQAICQQAGGDLQHIVKLQIFLTDLSNFTTVNEIMAQYFSKPYPARAAVGVKELPKGTDVEMDAIMVIT